MAPPSQPSDPAATLWSVVLEIEDIDNDSDRIRWAIPGWWNTHGLTVTIDIDDVPAWLTPPLELGRQTRALVNVGAHRPEDLAIAEWKRPRATTSPPN